MIVLRVSQRHVDSSCLDATSTVAARFVEPLAGAPLPGHLAKGAWFPRR